MYIYLHILYPVGNSRGYTLHYYSYSLLPSGIVTPNYGNKVNLIIFV